MSSLYIYDVTTQDLNACDDVCNSVTITGVDNDTNHRIPLENQLACYASNMARGLAICYQCHHGTDTAACIDF